MVICDLASARSSGETLSVDVGGDFSLPVLVPVLLLLYLCIDRSSQ